MTSPPVLILAGPSGSGKTHLLGRLVALLSVRGYRIATLKSHHGDLDRAGKDSDLHQTAGAVATVLVGRDGMLVRGPSSFVQAQKLLLQTTPFHLLLAEGFKEEPGPKLWVSHPPVTPLGVAGVIAQVGEEPLPLPLPFFHRDDVAGIARFLEEKGLLPVE